MVFIASFLGAAAFLSGMASALPRPADNGVSASQSTSTSSAVATGSNGSIGSSVSTSSQSTATTVVSSLGYGYGSSATYGSSSDSSYGSYGAYGDASFNSASSTYSAAGSYSTPVYGSGASNWGSNYDDCVSQCIAQFGSPDSTYQPTSTSSSEGSTGTGATHTVIVAPSQGVLRYVPFAVNASVGDTVQFMWGANNHTVTKSSELTPCNKTSDALFASGTHDKGFVFTQVVNDTNPVYFYCGTPTHCQQGMFGIINPPNAFGAAASVSASMQSINPDVAAYASYTSQQTANNLAASKWGGSIDLSALPEWAHASVAENVLYTRNFLASNPEILKEDGTIDLSGAPSTPLMIPQDAAAVLNNATLNNAASGSAPSADASSAASTSSATSEAATPTASGNGASSLASPRTFVALFVVVATFLTL